MNKKICFLLISLILLLTACTSGGSHMWGFFDNDREVSNERFEQILEAIKNKDKTALKKMFSKKAITDADEFDQTMIDLFDLFQGEVISWDDWGGTGSEYGMNDDGTNRSWKFIQSTYDVQTSQQKYRFAIKEFTKDTADPDNIGIYSLYIIKEEDSNLEFAYGGDGKWTAGIVIETKTE